MKMAVALIIGFPEETRDDLRDSIHFFIESLRYDQAKPQISLLRRSRQPRSTIVTKDNWFLIAFSPPCVIRAGSRMPTSWR